MADQPAAEKPPATYDPQKDAKTNADDDFKQIKEIFDNEGSQAAYARINEELTKVPAEQQRAYKEALAKALSSGENPLLPKLAVAFMADEKNLGNLVDDNGTVSRTRLSDRAYFEKTRVEDGKGDPLQAAFLENLSSRYDQLKKDLERRGDGRLGIQSGDLRKEMENESKAAAEAKGLRDKAETDKKNFGTELANNPALFEMLDGMDDNNKLDGHISKNDANKFLERWEKSEAFRNMWGKTPEEQERIKSTVTSLRDAFDQDGNKDDKKGSVIHENGWGTNTLSMKSLARGLGYSEDDQGVAKMKEDLKPKPVAPEKTPEQLSTERLALIKADPAMAKELAGAGGAADDPKNVITNADIAAIQDKYKNDAAAKAKWDPVLKAATDEIAKNGPIGLDKLGITPDQPAAPEVTEKQKQQEKSLLDNIIKNQELLAEVTRLNGKLPAARMKALADAAAAYAETHPNAKEGADFLANLAKTGEDVDLNPMAVRQGATDFADYVKKNTVGPEAPPVDPPDAEAEAALAAERTKVLKDLTQVSGEGPYQAAERLLGKGASPADVKALTRILQAQFMEEQKVSNWNAAIPKIEVGTQWVNEANLQAVIAKIEASGNATLKARFAKFKK